MRLFFAVKLSDELKQELSKFLEPFLHIRARVKWVEPKNLHLTLKFLGETEKSQLEDLKQGAETAAATASPFEIALQDCGAFPNLRAPRVFWIGVNDPEKRLTQLAKELDYNLSQFGWEREKRAFSPHLTLGRVKDRSGLTQVSEEFGRAKFPPVKLPVEAFYLVESQLRPAGPIYTDLVRFALEKK